MSPEKVIQLEAGHTKEQPTSKAPGRRSSLIATLGGLLLLSAGFSAGMTTTMLRNKNNGRRSSYDFDTIEGFQDPSVQTLESRAVLATTGTTMWKPAPGLTWNYQLSAIPTATQLLNPKEFAVWDIDLFDTPVTSIKTIQAAGSKVICYFSAGTYENWRPDALKFQAADKGKAMEDWAGETWIKTSTDNVRTIMKARLDLAVRKGCNGVDPDNIDGYDHDTGVNITQASASDYVKFLATEANKRGLSMGLKNSIDIIPNVLSVVQWSVSEQCAQYNECPALVPFITAGKPVFHVEYPKGDDVNNSKNVTSTKANAACACKAKWNFSPIIKNSNLNTWIQKC